MIPVNAAILSSVLSGTPDIPAILDGCPASMTPVSPDTPQSASVRAPIETIFQKQAKANKVLAGELFGEKHPKQELPQISAKPSAFLQSFVTNLALEVENQGLPTSANHDIPSQEQPAAPTITAPVLDAPVPTDDNTSAGSSFMGSLLMIGADLFDEVMTQKIVPMILSPASSQGLLSPKTISLRGRSMEYKQNPPIMVQGPLQTKYGFMGVELSAMSAHLQAMRAENAELKRQIAARTAAPQPMAMAAVQPAPRKASTMTRESITTRFGFTG
jgi:hypothetical protein